MVPLPTDSLFADKEGTQPGVRVSVYPLLSLDAVSYTHLTLPTIYSV